MKIVNEYFIIGICIHCGVKGKQQIIKTLEDMKLLKIEIICCACRHKHERGING